jgi:hypothetical protein
MLRKSQRNGCRDIRPIVCGEFRPKEIGFGDCTRAGTIRRRGTCRRAGLDTQDRPNRESIALKAPPAGDVEARNENAGDAEHQAGSPARCVRGVERPAAALDRRL